MQTCTSANKRIVSILVIAAVLIGLWTEVVQGKDQPPVVVEKITGIPETPAPGELPDISAIIASPRAADRGRTEVTVIVVLTRPDHAVRSWQWKKVSFAPDEKKSFTLPREYGTTLAGTYRIEYSVYSSDMEKQYGTRSRSFTVTARTRPAEASAVREKKKDLPGGQKEPQPQTPGTRFAAGVTGNIVNTAGGVTILAWPLPQVGLQASYAVGTITSREVRILGRYERSGWFNVYLGIGWLQVTKKANVIGVETTFSKSAPSAQVGIEIPLGRRLIGYLGVTGTTLRLREEVTTATQAATATVTYAPLSVEASLVLSVF